MKIFNNRVFLAKSKSALLCSEHLGRFSGSMNGVCFEQNNSRHVLDMFQSPRMYIVVWALSDVNIVPLGQLERGSERGC
jgi:hypothetical protein